MPDGSRVPAERPAGARLVLAVTHPMTARYLLRGQAAFLRGEGFDVWVLTSPGPDLETFRRHDAVPVEIVPMRREISPLADLRSLIGLVRALRRLRPQLVNAGTPKAGALGMLAAWLARVPVRVYTLRGLRIETATGPRRLLLRWAERTASRLAHRVVCVSPSLRRRAVELYLTPPAKTVVLAHGSSNGVDLDRFQPRREGQGTQGLRSGLGVPRAAPVIGFVGRFTRDKGLEDLLAAFRGNLADRFPECRLLLLGEYEEGDPLPAQLRRRLADDPRIVTCGFVPDTAPYYALMDVLAFPSHREGFPNAPLEAAASGVPTAGYAAVGTVDAVVDGVTGTLAPVGDVGALGAALGAYLESSALRREHGAAARARVEARFGNRTVWAAWADEYRRLLASGARP